MGKTAIPLIYYENSSQVFQLLNPNYNKYMQAGRNFHQ